MSKELNKNQQNHADWSAEKPSKKVSTGIKSSEYTKENSKNNHKKESSKSSLHDHFERYNNKDTSYNDEDYQD